MGRYYSGDIKGKFWFGVQNSDDASFFGVSGEQSFLTYCFDESNTESILAGIKKCKKKLGAHKERLDTFFDNNAGYTDEMLAKYLKVGKSTARGLLEWYARLGLGEEIRGCVEKKGSCVFNAEL